ncbi:MAG: CorA family divalent cation transporter [Halanaerobium sp.]
MGLEWRNFLKKFEEDLNGVFLTGLFGINIGGMPGTESNAAFGVFSVLMLVIIGIEYWLFKRNDWI